MLQLVFEFLGVWKHEKIYPKMKKKILEILTFNSARILRLTYAPRSATFIHLPFIARIFQPQDVSGNFVNKKKTYPCQICFKLYIHF